MHQNAFERGVRADREGSWQEAVSHFCAYLQANPDSFAALGNLAGSLWGLSYFKTAEIVLRKALSMEPSESLLWRQWGTVQRDLNHFEAADQAFRRAAEAGVQDPISAWNHSEILIGLERYQEAFALAERRFDEPIYAEAFHRCGPYWHNWDGGEEVRVWSEQGLGDTLQFARWLPELSRQLGPGRKLILEVEPPLLTLLQRGLRWLPQPLTVVQKQDPPAPWSGCQGSLLSLPHQLGGAPNPLPGPYLLDPAWQGASCRGNLQGRRRAAHPRIGVVWASGRRLDDPFTERLYRRRSLPTPDLVRLLTGLSDLGAELVNLQVGPDRQQAQAWPGEFVASLEPGADFAAMAEVMAGLDLTLSVDTAAAHLAGATGLPAWVLLPWNADGRWLRNRATTPWYPSLRLLRQAGPGDWQSLVEQALQAVAQWQLSGQRPGDP